MSEELDNYEEDAMIDEEVLIEMLEDIDKVIVSFLERGIDHYIISGALQARIAHLYTCGEYPDFEGLEGLLKSALDSITSRPKWEIE